MLGGRIQKRYWPSISHSSIFSEKVLAINLTFFYIFRKIIGHQSLILLCFQGYLLHIYRVFAQTAQLHCPSLSSPTSLQSDTKPRVSGCVKVCANSYSRYAASMTKRPMTSQLLFSTAAFLFPASMSANVFQISLLYGSFKRICVLFVLVCVHVHVIMCFSLFS